MKRPVAALAALSFATGSFACVVTHAWVDGHAGAKAQVQAKAPQKKRSAKPLKSQARILEKQAEAAAAL